MLHRWLNEIVIGGLNKAIVLLEHINNIAATLSDISLDTAGKTDVIRCQDKDLQVHQVTELLLINGVDAFEHDNGGGVDSRRYFGTLVSGEIVDGDVDIFSINEFIQFLIAKFEVKSIRVIEVVIFCVIMIRITIKSIR